MREYFRLLPVYNIALLVFRGKHFEDLLDLPLRPAGPAEHELENQREAGREEGHEEEEVDDDSEEAVGGEELEPLVAGEAAEADQEHLAERLERHDGPEVGHPDRQVLGDPPLVGRGEGELRQPGHLGNELEIRNF